MSKSKVDRLVRELAAAIREEKGSSNTNDLLRAAVRGKREESNDALRHRGFPINTETEEED